MGSGSVIPKPPKGFIIDDPILSQQGTVPPPPKGFAIDTPQDLLTKPFEEEPQSLLEAEQQPRQLASVLSPPINLGKPQGLVSRILDGPRDESPTPQGHPISEQDRQLGEYAFQKSIEQAPERGHPELGEFIKRGTVGYKDLFEQAEEKLPDVVKRAYNESLQGVADQLATGRKPFDLSDYEPNEVEKIGATVLSFFMPLDFASILLGGGIASTPVRSAMRKTIQKLVVSGRTIPEATRIVEKGALKLMARSSSGFGGLGAYGATGSALEQKLETGEIDAGQVVVAGLKSGLTGAAAGAAGTLAGRAGERLAGKAGEKIADFIGEIGAFGTVSPALEGRLPTPEDYYHAAAVIIGIRGVNALGSAGGRTIDGVAKTIKEKVDAGKSFEQAQMEVASEIRRGLEKEVQAESIRPPRLEEKEIETKQPLMEEIPEESLRTTEKVPERPQELISGEKGTEIPPIEEISGREAKATEKGLEFPLPESEPTRGEILRERMTELGEREPRTRAERLREGLNYKKYVKSIASDNPKFEELFAQKSISPGTPLNWIRRVKRRYSQSLELQAPDVRIKDRDIPEESPMKANEIKDVFRQVKDVQRISKQEAVRQLSDVLRPLQESKDLALFERLVITRDLMATSKEGLEVPGGLTLKELQKEYDRLYDTAAPNVLESVESHFNLMSKQGEELVQRGKIEKPRDDYFPHKVLQYYHDFGLVSRTGPRLRDPFRPYTKMRAGSEKPIKTDYVDTMIEHLTKFNSDNMIDRFNERVLKGLDITDRLVDEVLETHKAEGKEITKAQAKKLIKPPAGYAKYQPEPGNYFFTGNRLSDSALNRATEDLFGQLEKIQSKGEPLPDTVKELLGSREGLMIGRERPSFIIPDVLAKQFNQFRKYQTTGTFEKMSRDLTTLWKWNVLVLNPKYQTKNLMGDNLNLFFDDAFAFTKHPEALGMLINRSKERFGVQDIKYKKLSDRISKMAKDHGLKARTYIELAEELGVIDSGFTGIEIVEIMARPEFARFTRGALQKGVLYTKSIPKGLREVSTVRENWARLAKFLKDLDRIETGNEHLTMDERVRNVIRRSLGLSAVTPHTVRTRTANVEGLNKITAAAKASREALLDYGNFSRTEDRLLRRGLIPFWSWAKGNVVMQVKRATKSPINYFTKLATITFSMYAWNHGNDERKRFEERMPTWARYMPHLNIKIGGKMYALLIDSPWSDAAETLGLTGVARVLSLEGKQDIITGLNESIDELTQKWGSAAHPFLQEIYAQRFGKDVFTGYQFLPSRRKRESEKAYAARVMQARKEHALSMIRAYGSLKRMERMKKQGRGLEEEFLPIQTFPENKKRSYSMKQREFRQQTFSR